MRPSALRPNVQALIELELGAIDAVLPPRGGVLLTADHGATPAYAMGWVCLLVAHLHHDVGDDVASAVAAGAPASRFDLGVRLYRAALASSAAPIDDVDRCQVHAWRRIGIAPHEVSGRLALY